jgi:hypothetical protein
MDSELTIVGQIWQYNRNEYYFVASYDGADNKSLTGQTRYWYTLLPIDKKGEYVPDIIKYDTWTKITEMSSFRRICK